MRSPQKKTGTIKLASQPICVEEHQRGAVNPNLHNDKQGIYYIKFS